MAKSDFVGPRNQEWFLDLALSKGSQPAGAILSSIKVLKYTVVARSFHGLPENATLIMKQKIQLRT